MAYRQSSGTFNYLEGFDSAAISSIDATYDRSRIAHTCFVASGQLTHLAIDPAGQATTTSLGDGDRRRGGRPPTRGESIDATTDARGTVHVCVVAGGALTHFSFTADGTERVQSLGDGEQCTLGVDAVGTVHAVVRAGTAIRHATLD